jgi:glycosyltransferase involved in cell wall biosynthesis
VSRRMVLITELIAPYRIPVFNALARREEVELHVIFLSRTDSTQRQWRVYEEEIKFSYEVLPCWRRRVGKFNVLLNRGMAESLRKFAPDVVICGGYNYVSSWQALRWAKRHSVPFVLWSESTGNDSRNKHAPMEFLKSKFVGSCDGFVVPGQSARDYLLSLGVKSEDISIAPNAVDTALFASAGAVVRENETQLRAQLALPQRYFLFVGRLVAGKGVLDLLDAYERMSPALRASVGLVFAGEGSMRAELESRARDIHPGRVHFAGFVHRDELAAYYALAECFVFPTRTDPWGLVVNEAMACGLPVICTRVAGCAADLVQENGRLVSPANADELASAMEDIATNSDIRERMAGESRQAIQAHSPERCAAGLALAATVSETHVG